MRDFYILRIPGKVYLKQSDYNIYNAMNFEQNMTSNDPRPEIFLFPSLDVDSNFSVFTTNSMNFFAYYSEALTSLQKTSALLFRDRVFARSFSSSQTDNGKLIMSRISEAHDFLQAEFSATKMSQIWQIYSKSDCRNSHFLKILEQLDQKAQTLSRSILYLREQLLPLFNHAVAIVKKSGTRKQKIRAEKLILIQVFLFSPIRPTQ